MRRLLCWLGLHDPVEMVIQRGTLRDVLAGLPGTLEYRCRRCAVEVSRPKL